MISIKIGEVIKELRKEKGISASELARRSKISQPYLSQLETAKNNNPTTKVLEQIAKGLNVDYYYLMDKAGYLTPIDEVDIFGQENPFIFKVTNSDGVKSYKELTPNEVKKLTDLHETLIMGIDIFYKGKRLNDGDRKKVLTMLETILE